MPERPTLFALATFGFSRVRSDRVLGAAPTGTGAKLLDRFEKRAFLLRTGEHSLRHDVACTRIDHDEDMFARVPHFDNA